jgi:D-alanine transaminase
MKLAMIQDKIIHYENLEPAYLDRGTFFGDGVYEVIRSYNGRIFALDDHLERFERSIREIGIEGVDIELIKERVEQAFEMAEIAEAKIYFHITRGSESRNHSANENIKPNFFMTITDAPESTYEKANGVAVSTFPDWRWKRCDIKSLNLLANVLANMDARKKGCFEAILVDENGYITEGSHSAFFAVFTEKKQLITHRLGHDILPSITRKHVINLAEGTELMITEKSLTPDEAKVADELFLAVTTKDIVPVVSFDGTQIGDGRPGEYTTLLIQKFTEMIAGL